MHLAEHPPHELRDRVDVPKRMQIPLGIVVGGLSLLSSFFACLMLWAFLTEKRTVDGPNLIVYFWAAIVLAAMSVFLIRICLRLLRKKENLVGHPSPRALRLASWFILLPMPGMLFSGRQNTVSLELLPLMGILGSVFYIFRMTARRREAQMHNQSSEPTPSSVTPPAGQEPRPR
jgi:hypothetical protein